MRELQGETNAMDNINSSNVYIYIYIYMYRDTYVGMRELEADTNVPRTHDATCAGLTIADCVVIVSKFPWPVGGLIV